MSQKSEPFICTTRVTIIAVCLALYCGLRADAGDVDTDKSIPTPVRFEKIWVAPTPLTSAVYSASDRTIVACALHRCDAFGLDGKRRTSFGIIGDVRVVLTAKTADNGVASFIGYRPAWGPSVVAFDFKGKILWHRTEGAINDVFVADLNGDRTDEILVGYNGSDGVYLLDHLGNEKWHNSTLGTVSSVTAGDFVKGNKSKNVAVVANGTVHILDDAGRSDKQISAHLHAAKVRFARLQPESVNEALIVYGEKRQGGGALAAIDNERGVLWEGESEPALEGVRSIAICRKPPLAACSLRSPDEIWIIDCKTGRKITVFEDIGERPVAAWAEGETIEHPLLLITSTTGLHVYRSVQTGN